MQAIQTHFLAPTDHKDARVVARAAAARIVVVWQDELHIDANHARAARMLAQKLNWSGVYAGGSLPDGSSVFVNVADMGAGFEVPK